MFETKVIPYHDPSESLSALTHSMHDLSIWWIKFRMTRDGVCLPVLDYQCVLDKFLSLLIVCDMRPLLLKYSLDDPVDHFQCQEARAIRRLQERGGTTRGATAEVGS